MDRDALIAKLMVTFLEELGDHVRALERDLLELERKPGAERRVELLHTLFRTAHSLKGASRSVGQRLLERACHELEDTLGAWQQGTLAPSKELFRVLFAMGDAIGAVGDELRAGAVPVSTRIEALLPLLAATRARVRTELLEDEHAAGVMPAPVSSVAYPSPGESSIRVSTRKLDDLLVESGELLGARRRLLTRLDDIGGLREAIGQFRQEWRTVAPSISDLVRHPERTSLPLTRRSALVLTRAGDHLRKLAHAVERLEGMLARDRHDLELAAKPLEESVRGVRLLPFREGCVALERAARDVAEASGKQLELVVTGDVELDRSVIEALKDPLLHLVHNAVDHGIELPDERRRLGKSPVGRLVVSAAVRAGWVEVTVADDGRGIDLDAIREQAVARGLTPGPGGDLVRLLFEPAFSTARKVSRTSGRGVGLDVVKSHVDALRGTIEVSFVKGAGTRFLLRVPHTLLTMRVLLVRASDEVFALPSANVARLVRVSKVDVRSIDGHEVISIGGDETPAPIPIVSLSGLLERLPRSGGVERELPAASHVAALSAVVLEVSGRRAALVVDELLDEHEVVVKSLGPRLSALTRHQGATLLPTGKMALILNPSTLVDEAVMASQTRLAAAAEATPRRKRILVVDDSITTRALEKSILEGAGYDVSLAVDGEDALRVLGERAFDLVVTDVEMPRLGGLELTSAIRRSTRLKDVPVVLVTGLGDDAAKARGVEAGADAYLVKSGFDQRALLDTIGRLL